MLNSRIMLHTQTCQSMKKKQEVYASQATLSGSLLSGLQKTGYY